MNREEFAQSHPDTAFPLCVAAAVLILCAATFAADPPVTDDAKAHEAVRQALKSAEAKELTDADLATQEIMLKLAKGNEKERMEALESVRARKARKCLPFVREIALEEDGPVAAAALKVILACRGSEAEIRDNAAFLRGCTRFAKREGNRLQAAARIAEVEQDKTGLDVLVSLLRSGDRAVAVLAMGNLSRLTKEDVGKFDERPPRAEADAVAQKWETWWKGNRGKFVMKQSPLRPGETQDPLLAGEGWTAKTRKVNVAGPRGEEVREITYYRSPVGMEFVRIPAGEYVMGSPETEAFRNSDEGPQHRVRIRRPFFLGTCEVTVGQFRKFVEATHYRTAAEEAGGALITTAKGGAPSQGTNWNNPPYPQTDDHPVICVNWHDAQAFCDWAGARLPTETEWEYACRAGAQTTFWWGEDTQGAGKYANVADRKFMEFFHVLIPGAFDKDDHHLYTTPAGSLLPNQYGLYDMIGNVWEWCQNRYAGRPGTGSEDMDAKGDRVLRGGSWNFGRTGCRSASRYPYDPTIADDNVGFRVVWDPLYRVVEWKGMKEEDEKAKEDEDEDLAATRKTMRSAESDADRCLAASVLATGRHDKEAMGILVGLLRSKGDAVANFAWQSLRMATDNKERNFFRRPTGESSPEDRARKWEAWWKDNRETFK